MTDQDNADYQGAMTAVQDLLHVAKLEIQLASLSLHLKNPTQDTNTHLDTAANHVAMVAKMLPMLRNAINETTGNKQRSSDQP